MKVLFWLLILLAPGLAMGQNEEQKIRSIRSASNAAIKSHDTSGIVTYWTEDIVITKGSGEVLIGKGEAINEFKKTFNELPDIYFVRSPENIVVGKGETKAWEDGSWKTYRGETLQEEYAGKYSIYWVKQEGEWLMRSQIFVNLQ